MRGGGTHYYIVLYYVAFFIFLVDPPTGETESDSNLEGWQITLIIVIPLVAVVIMLSIGIYCACRQKSHNSELEMGTMTNMNNKDYTQVHHNQ